MKDGTQWDASKIGSHSVAFGRDTKASGSDAVAMGERSIASGLSATALGVGTTASGLVSTAMGSGTTASAAIATAIGFNTVAATSTSLSVGSYNDANRSSDETLLVVGNGSSGNRSDALVLDDQGNLTTSGSVNGTSDRRLKTNIEPIGDGVLPKLARLRPVRYEFRNQNTHPDGEQIGLVAQDVRKEFPSLVRKGSGGYLSLAYPKMTAVLLKGLQEQQSEISTLETKNRTLQKRVGEIEDLKARLAALETERSSSAVAGVPGSATGLLLAFLLGGLVGAGLVWRNRN